MYKRTLNTTNPPPERRVFLFDLLLAGTNTNVMATYYNENTVVYHDGEYLRASEVKTDLYGQSLHYGYGVFEGIRSYKTEAGETKVFKAEEHYQRLIKSASALNIPFHYSVEELVAATYELLRRNNFHRFSEPR